MADYKAMYIQCISALAQIDDELSLLKEKVKQAQIAAESIYLSTTECSDSNVWQPTVVKMTEEGSET